MRACSRLGAVVVLALVVARPAMAAGETLPERRLAVLEFRAPKVDPSVLAVLSDAARAGSLTGAGARPLRVMTRENIAALLKDVGDGDCAEGECELETARSLGADLVITGEVARVDEMFVVTLKLHHVEGGALLSSRQVSGKTQFGLLEDVKAAAAAMIAQLYEAPPPPPAIAPRPTGPRPKTGRVLTFGVQPQWSRDQMERMFQPLMDYLGEQTGHTFQLRVTEDYGALLDELDSGLVDLGKFSPYGYVLARKSQGVKIFATEETNGRAWYQGLVVVRKDSRIASLEELKGRSFSFTDPNSTSGFVYPRALLVERGEDPNTYFSRTFYAGSHDVCIKGVYQKKVDGCATWDVAFEDEANSKLFGVDAGELTIIHRTDPIPNDAYAARADLEDDIVRDVQQALLALSADKKKLREVIDWKTRIDGFVPGDDAVYGVVREKVAMKDQKPRLAVLPFDKRGVGFEGGSPGQIAAELLAVKLFDSQRFLLVENARVEKALASLKLGPAELQSPGNARKAGLALGAELLLAGTVMKLDGELHVTCRLLEASTGRVLSAQHGKGAALEAVIDEVTAQLVSGFEVRGFVLKVQSTENLTVDLGTLQGLKPGDPLVLYRNGELLVHPVTGKTLGTEELLVGEALTVRTTPEISFAKVLLSDEAPLQGMRVRSLRKGETAHHVRDSDGVIRSYLDEEREKYDPWLSKYAWRIAAVGSVPALWAFAAGNRDDQFVYGGIAAGLWGAAGVTYVYYAATEEDRRVPSYVAKKGENIVRLQGSF